MAREAQARLIGDGPSPLATRDLYLPFVATAPVVVPASPPDPVAAFYAHLKSDPRQQRTSLTACPCLEAAAAWKARDLATHGYWSHRASTGEMPNGTARRHGCRLPATYTDDGNYVECLVAGSADAGVMFEALATSPSHRFHLLGLNEFFAQQHTAGVALYELPGSEFTWYWAVYIAVVE